LKVKPVSAKKDASRRNISAMARDLAPLAMEKLKKLMNSENESVAKDASIHILDRAIGKPIAMTADVTDRLDEFTDEQLDAAIDDVAARIIAAEKVAGKETTAPVTH
jgi:hypothetical protein